MQRDPGESYHLFYGVQQGQTVLTRFFSASSSFDGMLPETHLVFTFCPLLPLLVSISSRPPLCDAGAPTCLFFVSKKSRYMTYFSV